MGKSGAYDRLAQVGRFLLYRDNFIPYGTLQSIRLFLIYEKQKNSIESELWVGPGRRSAVWQMENAPVMVY